MVFSKKILMLLILSSCLAGALSTNAKTKRSTNHCHKFTIGFSAGKEILYTTPLKIPLKNSRLDLLFTTFTIKKQIAPHLHLQSGISYGLLNLLSLKGESISYQRNKQFSMPLTVQYHPLPRKCRMQPYIGAGVQYNVYNTYGNTTVTTSPEGLYNYNTTGNKYVSIVFTQGVIFEVNTKIEIIQSIHFIPNSNEPVIGIDLGIGIRIP
jgi:hypothetical protein